MSVSFTCSSAKRNHTCAMCTGAAPVRSSSTLRAISRHARAKRRYCSDLSTRRRLPDRNATRKFHRRSINSWRKKDPKAVCCLGMLNPSGVLWPSAAACLRTKASQCEPRRMMRRLRPSGLSEKHRSSSHIRHSASEFFGPRSPMEVRSSRALLRSDPSVMSPARRSSSMAVSAK